jgi:hypothetical protein
MPNDEIGIVLSRAPSDPERNDPEFREQVRAFSKVLHDNGVRFSERGMAFDSVSGSGGFFSLGEYTIPLVTGVLTIVGTACGAWLQGRYGRKVRIKVGDVEAEARTLEEIDALLKRVGELRDEDDKRDKSTHP